MPRSRKTPAIRRRRNPQPPLRRNPAGASSIFGSLGGAAADYVTAGLERGIGRIGKAIVDSTADKLFSLGQQALHNLLLFSPGQDPDSAIDPSYGIPKWLVKGITDDSTIHAIVGERGSGKSSLAHTLGEFMNRQVYMVDAPDSILKASGGKVKRVKTVEEIKNIPPGSVVLIDDAQEYISSRRFMSDRAIIFETLIYTSRHRGLTIITTMQNTSTVNRAGLTVTLLWLKEPTFAWTETERDVIRPILEIAMGLFKQKPRAEWKRWVFVFKDQGHYGLVTYSPPDWYSASVSKYRSAQQGQGQGQVTEGDYREVMPKALGDGRSPAQVQEYEIDIESEGRSGIPTL